MNDLATAVSAALAELNRIIAPLQRLSAELRELDQLELSDADRAAIAKALRDLTTNLRTVAESAAPVSELAGTLKQIRVARNG